jgi:hypothetical protein
MVFRPDNYFICERSGQKLPRSQLVIEPGTNLKVGRKYADPAAFTLANHPQARMNVKIAGDTQMLKVRRPETNMDNEARIIIGELGPVDYIVDEDFYPIYY